MIETDASITGPINIGNSNEFTMLELAEKVLAFTGSRSKVVLHLLPQDDPKQRQPDIKKANDLLGREPKVDLPDGLRLPASGEYFRNKSADRTDGLQMVLKVNIRIDKRFAVRFAPLLSVRPQLEDVGIRLDENLRSYDMQIVQTSLVRVDAEDFLNDRCTILYERADAATLGDHPAVRVLIRDPRVRVWIREYTLRNPALHNVPMVSGRYHYALISDNAERRMPRVVVPDNDLAKIRTIMPIYAYPFFDLPRKFQRVPLERRRIALFCAGTIDYAEPIVTQHRRAAARAIERLEEVPRLVGYGRVLPKPQFQQTLTQTKIFLSPFGLGEFSWKDYEAIYAGCVLVKPQADFVTTYGFDIYAKNRYCVVCRHDFSDLEDIVDDILSNEARYQDLADQARTDLLKAAELESYAADVAKLIKEAAAI